MNRKTLIDIIGDLADVRELIIAMIISSCSALLGYILCPLEKPYPLFFGLFALLISFVINNILFKPKRKIIYQKKGDSK